MKPDLITTLVDNMIDHAYTHWDHYLSDWGEPLIVQSTAFERAYERVYGEDMPVLDWFDVLDHPEIVQAVEMMEQIVRERAEEMRIKLNFGRTDT